jgi:hypothetical protein
VQYRIYQHVAFQQPMMWWELQVANPFSIARVSGRLWEQDAALEAILFSELGVLNLVNETMYIDQKSEVFLIQIIVFPICLSCIRKDIKSGYCSFDYRSSRNHSRD